MATYCLPSTAKAIGFALTAPPSCRSQSGLPLSASSAKKLPSSVPPNTSPPAVASRPDHGGDRSLNSHFRAPVVESSARTAPHASSPLTARPPPATNGSPALYFDSPL